MNTRTTGIRAISLAAVVTIGGTAVFAQGTASDQTKHLPQQAQTDQQQMSGQNPDDQQLRIVMGRLSNGIDQLEGKDVRSTPDKEKLGDIKDFVIDPNTGNVPYAVVASGGVMGIGEKLRLVPLKSLRRVADDADLYTELRKADWEALPMVSERNLKEGRLTLTDEQKRQLSQSQSAQQRGEQQGTDGLLGAKTLRGQEVRAGDQEVGEIKDVVVDFDTGSARAFLEAEAEFAGSGLNFLVPFSKLQIGSTGQGMVTTSLNRADFERASGKGTQTAAMVSSDPRGGVSFSEQSQQQKQQQSTAQQGVTGTERETAVSATAPTSMSGYLPQSDAASQSRIAAQPGADRDVSAGQTSPTQSSETSARGETVAASQTSTSTSQASTSQSVGDRESRASMAEQASASARGTEAQASRDTSRQATQQTEQEQQRLTRQSTEQSQDIAMTQQSAEQAPTPTGRMDAAQGSQSIDPVLQSAARAIRQAWDANPELAKLDLRVTPQNGRLVFQGTVPNAELRQRAKSTAEEVLSKIRVEDQISVQNQNK